jgi:hypothetical protein
MENKMGLDMYLIGRKSVWNNHEKPELDRKEDGFDVDAVELSIGYWRKHPNLHGFIVQTFADGVDECQRIELDSDALVKIMAAVKDKKLPETTGFFFGRSATEDAEREEEIKGDLEILGKALAWVEQPVERESRSLIYQASW